MRRRLGFGSLLKLGLLLVMLFALAGCAATVPGGRNLDAVAAREVSPLDRASLDDLTADELLLKGDEAGRRGNLKAAVLFFAKAAEKAPQRPEPDTRLAELQLYAGRSDDAHKLFDQALKLDPHYLPALLGAGRATRTDDRPTALVYFEQALAVAPDNAEVLTELAITQEMDHRLPAAEANYRRALRLRPHDAGAHNNLGFNLLLQKRYKEALPQLEQGHDLAPRDPQILNNLALACFLLGQDDQALRYFTDSADQAGAYNNLGCFYMMGGELDKAEAAFRRAMELNPRYYVRAQENLARLAALRGKQPTARPAIVVRLQRKGGASTPPPASRDGVIRSLASPGAVPRTP